MQGDVHMVTISEKAITTRRAVSEGTITMEGATLNLIMEGKHAKGDVLSVARIAGIMATKRAADLIPLCHPIPITHVDIEFETDMNNNQIHCRVSVETLGQTGVEIEALAAVQIALLTIYDMCKKVDRGMTISSIRLLEKSGGASGLWKRSDD